MKCKNCNAKIELNRAKVGQCQNCGVLYADGKALTRAWKINEKKGI